MLHAICHLVRTGCKWRLLRKDFPPWSTVHTWYRCWRKDGTWQRVHEALRQQARRRAGSQPSPRTSAVDGQSVKTAGQGGEKGYDAGKKVAGHKRHIWLDSTGLLLAVLVTGAGVADGRAACDLLHNRLWDELPRLEVVYTDSQYRAGCLQEDVFDLAPFRLHVVSRPADAEGFVHLPQRWVAERTFAWLGRYRRLFKDCEWQPASSEALIHVSMIHLLVRRLAPPQSKRSQRFCYAVGRAVGCPGGSVAICIPVLRKKPWRRLTT